MHRSTNIKLMMVAEECLLESNVIQSGTTILMFQMNVLPPQSGNMSEKIFYLAGGNNTLLQHTGQFAPNYMALYLRRQYSWHLIVE
jgi:hypothetical protein